MRGQSAVAAACGHGRDVSHGAVGRNQELALAAGVLDTGHDAAWRRRQPADQRTLFGRTAQWDTETRTPCNVWRSTSRMNGRPWFPAATMRRPVGPLSTGPRSLGSGSGGRDRAGAPAVVPPPCARSSTPSTTLAAASVAPPMPTRRRRWRRRASLITPESRSSTGGRSTVLRHGMRTLHTGI